MATLQLSDEQLQTILGALRHSEAQFTLRAGLEEMADVRAAFRKLATQNRELHRQIKDGQLTAKLRLADAGAL